MSGATQYWLPAAAKRLLDEHPRAFMLAFFFFCLGLVPFTQIAGRKTQEDKAVEISETTWTTQAGLCRVKFRVRNTGKADERFFTAIIHAKTDRGSRSVAKEHFILNLQANDDRVVTRDIGIDGGKMEIARVTVVAQ
jgi:hypothetical protein